MKKSLLLLCSILLVNFVSADEFEKNYGNGVVHIQPDSIFNIEFYDAPNGEVIHRLGFFHNAWAMGRTVVTFDRFRDSVPAWFKTEYFIPNGEYARVDIKAVDSVDGFYRTLLRDSANREVWIKKQKHVSFLSWLGFYNTVANVELNQGDIILYNSPDPKSKRVNYTPMIGPDDRGSMRALEIKGRWMKVELQFPQRDPMMTWQKFTGWIQWRDDKQPLIKYNLMGC
jgi:hypothetical protein